MQDDKIVGVADVMCCLQIALYEVIKHVHVDIDQKLARKVTERKSDAGPAVRVKTPDHFREEPKNICVVDMPFDDVEENRMIDVGKELSYVAFQHPSGTGVVFGNLGGKFSKTIDCAMRTPPLATGVRIKNEFTIEEWI